MAHATVKHPSSSETPTACKEGEPRDAAEPVLRRRLAFLRIHCASSRPRRMTSARRSGSASEEKLTKADLRWCRRECCQVIPPRHDLISHVLITHSPPAQTVHLCLDGRQCAERAEPPTAEAPQIVAIVVLAVPRQRPRVPVQLPVQRQRRPADWTGWRRHSLTPAVLGAV